MIKYIILFLLLTIPCEAEIIYSPATKEPVYEYIGIINKDTVFKSSDFLCFISDTTNSICRAINLFHPMDYTNSLPLDGFDFWAWERGRSFPAKAYRIYTFLVKREGKFVWEPYNIDEINNLMGD